MTARGTNSDEVRCSVKLDAFEKAVGADPPDPAATAAVRDHRERAAHERAARLAYDADAAARRRRLAQPVEYTLLGGRLTDEQLTRLRNDDADLVAQRAAHRPAPAPWTRSDPARPGLHIDSATMTKGPPFDAGSNRERAPDPQWVDAQPEGDFHLHVLSIGETHDTGFIWRTTNFLAPQDGQARFSATLNFSVSRTIDTSYAPPAGQSLRTDLDVYDISAPYGPSGLSGCEHLRRRLDVVADQRHPGVLVGPDRGSVELAGHREPLVPGDDLLRRVGEQPEGPAEQPLRDRSARPGARHDDADLLIGRV